MGLPKVNDLVERAAGSIFMTSDLVGSGGVGGGLLNREQAATFIRMIVDKPTLLNEIRTVTMNGPQMRIHKIVMSDTVLHKPTGSITALSSSDYAAPDTSYVDLNTQELVAEVRLPYDVLEDNIERGTFEQTVMELVTDKISYELEDLLISGDTAHATASPPSPPTTWSPTDMRLAQDGVLKLADAYSVSFATPPATKDENVFVPMIQALPARYKTNKSDLRIYASHRLEFDFARYLGTRLTGYGDARLTGEYNNMLQVFGLTIRPCSLIPDGTMLLCNPKNLIMGFQRRMMVEIDRDISSREIIMVFTLRIAVQIEDKYGVVVCTGIY